MSAPYASQLTKSPVDAHTTPEGVGAVGEQVRHDAAIEDVALGGLLVVMVGASVEDVSKLEDVLMMLELVLLVVELVLEGSTVHELRSGMAAGSANGAK